MLNNSEYENSESENSESETELDTFVGDVD